MLTTGLGATLTPLGADLAESVNRFFDAAGTFTDSATLSGTVTIDTTTGVVTTVAFKVSTPDSVTLDSIYFQQADYPVAGIYETVADTTATPPYPGIAFGIPLSSLVGYDGGELISDTQPGNGGYVTGLYLSSTDIIALSQGTLSSVPEPSSILVLSTAALVLVAATVGWRRAGL